MTPVEEMILAMVKSIVELRAAYGDCRYKARFGDACGNCPACNADKALASAAAPTQLDFGGDTCR